MAAKRNVHALFITTRGTVASPSNESGSETVAVKNDDTIVAELDAELADQDAALAYSKENDPIKLVVKINFGADVSSLNFVD
ncbi:hypothetical protein MBANPS3_010565 [Mucor bainieri]